MGSRTLYRSPWVLARYLLASSLLFAGLALPATALAQALNVIDGDVTQKITLSDLHEMSDTTFTLYDPYQGRDVEMQGVAFRDFLVDQFGEVPPMLHFTAWDDYEVTLDGWDDPSWYLITKEDGEPLTLRSRGPVRLVERDYNAQGNEERDVENLREFNDWVWMIRSIEAKW